MAAVFALTWVLLMRTPFGGLSRIVDILAALSCGLVFYLGWDAFQDLR